MKTARHILLISLPVIVLLILAVSFAASDKPDGILGTWYLTELQDLDYYPGVIFRGNGDDESFTVYTDGKEYIRVEKGTAYPCSFEDNTLDNSYRLDGDCLVRVLNYDGKDHMIMVFSRTPPERKVSRYTPDEQRLCFWHYCEDASEFNGEWSLVMYGEYGAFASAGEMNMEGKAVIENGHLSMTWSRNGKEKKAEASFDDTLNLGRLYTIVDNARSYIITMLDENTILFNVGLNEAQWVFRRDD